METEASTTERRPESVLASEAEKRVSTANGRPITRELTNQEQVTRPTSKRTNQIQGNRPSSKEVANHGSKTPQNTPRDLNVANGKDSIGDVLTIVGEEAVAQENDVLDDILDEDELFMTLTPVQKEEWDKMISERERQLETSKEKHQEWSDSFTRRRMFALSRMRKLNLSYENRVQLFSNMADTISRVVSRKSSGEHTKAKTVKKTMSDPAIEAKKLAKALKRNNTSDTIVSLNQKPVVPASDGLSPKDVGSKMPVKDSKSLSIMDSSNVELQSKDASTPVCKVEKVNAT